MWRWFGLGLLGLAAAGIGFWVASERHGLGDGAASNRIISMPGASVFESPREVPAFHLQDKNGQPFGRESLQGKWSFLFFGYTYCPDVCPTALSNFASVYDRLKAQKPSILDDTQFVFVSVDPERDTTARLKAYVEYYQPAFTAATGDPKELEAFSRAMGAVYVKVPGESEGSYLMDHSATVYLVDPKGRLKALFTAPQVPDQVFDALVSIRS